LYVKLPITCLNIVEYLTKFGSIKICCLNFAHDRFLTSSPELRLFPEYLDTNRSNTLCYFHSQSMNRREIIWRSVATSHQCQLVSSADYLGKFPFYFLLNTPNRPADVSTQQLPPLYFMDSERIAPKIWDGDKLNNHFENSFLFVYLHILHLYKLREYLF